MPEGQIVRHQAAWDSTRAWHWTSVQIVRVSSERQISSKNFNNLSQGKFEPYFPSKDILRKFREIAAGIDEEDPFAAAAGDVRDLQQGFRQLNLGERFQGFATGGKVNSQPLITGIDEAIPALVDLRNQMAQLDLDDEFGVDVSDYIVEEQEIITPPLGPQPQPIVQKPQISQQINPQTNLTGTETALLSPTEKVIAGRS